MESAGESQIRHGSEDAAFARSDFRHTLQLNNTTICCHAHNVDDALCIMVLKKHSSV
jgi:hypothetical protein